MELARAGISLLMDFPSPITTTTRTQKSVFKDQGLEIESKNRVKIGVIKTGYALL